MTSHSDALVKPDFAQHFNTDWLAFIYIRHEPTDSYLSICSGVLIDPYWVLSSRGCLYDPYELIEIVSLQNKSSYYIELWGQIETFEVVKSIPSPDRRLVMHKLNKPAMVAPIKRSSMTPQDLIGTTMEVPGYYESESLGNSKFNPDGDIGVSCRISGELFYFKNSQCYILSPEYQYFYINWIYGYAVDPQTAGPLTSPLDDDHSQELSDDALFIDFKNGSYPCYEDMGSPVIANIDGERQLAGLVGGVGIVSRLSVCTNSVYNTYPAISHYEEFINQTLLRDSFDADCPVATTLQMEELGNNSVRLFWEPQQSATGYRMLYTPHLGYEPLQAVDVGNVTEVSSPVDPTTTYSISLIAYNDSCTSQPSSPVTILLEKP